VGERLIPDTRRARHKIGCNHAHMPVAVTGYSHVRVTVTDIARSRAFYDGVFGFPVAYELPADADEATREQLWFLFGGVIYQVPGGLFGLRPSADAGDVFDENRAGLDHVSFTVADRAAIDAAAAVLDELGVKHDGVKDIGAGFILEFRDPDNIALELMAPAS
jgi:glyoxylase I family protein